MIKKLFSPKKEDSCPNCGEACYVSDVLCPNCGKNLDDLYEQLPSELTETKSFVSVLKENQLLIKRVLAILIGMLLLFYWIIFFPTWKSLQAAEAAEVFSGEYYMGFFWSWHLSIKPDQTFSLDIFTDMGSQLEYTGIVSIEGNHLRLITSDAHFYEPAELIPVRWGQRKYIISADMVLEFCDDIAQGFEPRDDVMGGPFYLRDGDWEKSVKWTPILLDGHSLCP